MAKKFELPDGRRITLREASHICGLRYAVLWKRIKDGMSLQEAMDTPRGIPGSRGSQCLNGSRHTLKSLSEMSGISETCLQYRIHDMGLTAEQAISMKLLRVRKNDFKAIEYRGVVKSLTEWSKVVGIDYLVLYMRLKRSFTVEMALETPHKTIIRTPSIRRARRNFKHIEIEGIVHSLSEWSELLGICEATVRHRLQVGWDVLSAFKTPVTSASDRSKKMLTCQGSTHCVKEWAIILGCHPETLSRRLKKFDYSLERTLEGWREYVPTNQ